VQGDVSRLPFEAATFDVITAFETVYFWPGPVESFQEVWRVLKPGGTFMIVNESDGRNTKDEKWAGIIDGMRIFTQERLTQYLKDAGFSQIAAHVNRKQHWICLLAEKAR